MNMGISRVLVSSMNKTILNLPADFMDGLVAVNANEMNSEWVEYYTRKMDKKPNYDYYIDIILQNIDGFSGCGSGQRFDREENRGQWL